jgi:hypothetical protein
MSTLILKLDWYIVRILGYVFGDSSPWVFRVGVRLAVFFRFYLSHLWQIVISGLVAVFAVDRDIRFEIFCG